MALNPVTATAFGDHRYDGRLVDAESGKGGDAGAGCYLDMILAIDRQLPEERLTREVFVWRRMDLEALRFAAGCCR
jgi:hypothetical protein